MSADSSIDHQSLDDASYEDLFENAPCGYLVTTIDGVITRANRTMVGWLGAAAEDLVGRQFGELLETGSRMFYETRLRPTLQLRGEIHEVALQLAREGTEAFPVLVNATLATSDSGGDTIRMAVIDSTERLDYERNLLAARRLAEASEARVRVLQDASSAFGATTSDESLTLALVDSARNAFDATAAVVLLMGQDGRLAVLASTHPSANAAALAADAPVFDAIRGGEVVTIAGLGEAAESYPSLVETMTGARFQAMSVAPLLADDGTAGVLICFFGRARDFDEHVISLHEALARLGSQVLGRIRLQRQLEHAARHDTLTGLANRALLRESLGGALLAAEASGASIAMVFLDLDGFKAINDQLGHAIGDSVLTEVAARLASSVRQEDIIGRFGGDEFVIICADAGEQDAAAVAERVRHEVARPMPGIPGELVVSASVGVAVYRPSTGDTVSSDGLFRLADAAMYESKERGGNCVTIVSSRGERG